MADKAKMIGVHRVEYGPNAEHTRVIMTDGSVLDGVMWVEPQRLGAADFGTVVVKLFCQSQDE